jgi:hypothetical protein
LGVSCYCRTLRASTFMLEFRAVSRVVISLRFALLGLGGGLAGVGALLAGGVGRNLSLVGRFLLGQVGFGLLLV